MKEGFYDRFSFKAKIKRIESILSLIILIFSSPIILLAGLLIKIEDGGPIFIVKLEMVLKKNNLDVIN